MKPVRVLVIDDSATMRAFIRGAMSAEPGIEVVGEAGDPLEAREAIKALSPDVLTLDVEMPNMNGIDFLERLMRLRPMPVIMISTLTQKGAETTLDALELGAFDCIGKPGHGNPGAAFVGLTEKILAAAKARVRPSEPNRAPPQRQSDYKVGDKVLAIGSSTGGVEALQTLLTSFPEHCPATIITQHMPPTFTRHFAERLDRICAPRIFEAFEGAPIVPGTVYIAPGGNAHLEVSGRVGALRCHLAEGETVSGHRPSVDVMFSSVTRMVGARAVGVILTGMGRDGAKGLLAMRQAGASTLGQDEATCVVFGMPKAAHEAGAVEKLLPLGRIGPAALSLCAAQARGIK